MKFSVVVSIYKVEKFLENCISSILNQSYTNFELILVDDGSPDNCPLICDKFKDLDSRVKVIHKKNEGLVSTRKAGLKIATGEYICFIDGDDFIQNDMFEHYHQILLKNNVDIILGNFTAFYENGNKQVYKQNLNSGLYGKTEMEQKIYNRMLSCEPFYSFLIFPSLCVKCFKKHLVEKAYDTMLNEITLGEDAAITYPCLLDANSIYITDYSGYMYRQNQSSMTHSYDKNLYIKIKNLLTYLEKASEIRNWDCGNQISEYKLNLLFEALNNELFYNHIDSFKTKKKNFLVYLNDESFKKCINKIKIKGFKNKFKVFMFKIKLIYGFYLMGKINGK